MALISPSRRLRRTPFSEGVEAAGVKGEDARPIVIHAQMTTEEAKELKPHVVFVDSDNKIMATGFDPAETFDGDDLVRGDVTARR